jgi:hypothetical protein
LRLSPPYIRLARGWADDARYTDLHDRTRAIRARKPPQIEARAVKNDAVFRRLVDGVPFCVLRIQKLPWPLVPVVHIVVDAARKSVVPGRRNGPIGANDDATDLRAAILRPRRNFVDDA